MAERWVTTVCDRCYVGCGIKVHVVDNVVLGIEGDPDNPLNRGKMCAKGKAGIMAHYTPTGNMRLPIYPEHFPRKGEELEEVIQGMGIDWDFSDHTALPQFVPCDAFEEMKKGEYLVGVHYKLAFVYGHYSNENPWIDDLSFMRHTGEWVELYRDLSLDECLAAIKDEPWFLP